MKSNVSLFPFLVLLSVLSAERPPVFQPGDGFKGFNISRTTETIETHVLERWAWSGEINFISDPFQEWYLKGSAGNLGLLFLHRADLESRILIWSARMPTTESTYYDEMETLWNDYISRLSSGRLPWTVESHEVLSSRRPMLNFIPFVAKIHYSWIDQQKEKQEEVRYFQISPDPDGRSLLCVVLETPPGAIGYHENRLSRWLAGIAVK